MIIEGSANTLTGNAERGHKLAYFNTCAYCGATLDPQEVCDCQEEKEIKREALAAKWRSMTKTESNGQIKFILTTNHEREDGKK